MLIREQRSTCPAEAHDTRWAYQRYGCRCPVSVALNTEHNRLANGRRLRIVGTRTNGRAASGAQVDMSRVLEAVAGHRVALNTLELAAALDLYDTNGRSRAEVARRLGCTTRTVTRRRAVRRACPQAVSTVVDRESA